MEHIELYENKINCCGCGACRNVCPQNAIEMQEDVDGFVYPHIDHKKCVACGLCKKVCSFQKEEPDRRPLEGYAAINKDTNRLQESASGGVFAALAEEMLRKQGNVYGAAFEQQDNTIVTKHIRISTLEELERLQGSKYMQSDIGDTYKQVREDLKNGKKVLFSGTPCQVAGLRGFLMNLDCTNLYTVDIVCHGVTNQKMFRDYLEREANKYRGKIVDFTFRDKNIGWGYYGKYKLQRGKKIHEICFPSYTSSYYNLFLHSDVNRENCYKCKYTQEYRTSDLTIGDYWGIEKQHPEWVKDQSMDKGVSCILANTEKGIQFINDTREKFYMCQSGFKQVSEYNEQLNHPCSRPKERELLLEQYRKNGYKSVEKYFYTHYDTRSKKQKIKDICKNLIIKCCNLYFK